MRKFICFFWILAAVIVISCVSAPQPPPPSSTPKPAAETGAADTDPEMPDEMEFMGGGINESLLGSMNGAKADAIRKGVIYIIGEGKESANSDKLESVLYDSKHHSAYVELIERTRKDSVDGKYVYEGRYMVKLKAVENTLKAHGIIGGEATASVKPEIAAVEEEKDTGTADDVELENLDNKPLTAEEQRFIADYVDKMSFLVYFSEEVDEDKLFKDLGIDMANEFLITEGYTVIDSDQLEKLQKDQESIFEEETGEGMSYIQFLAQKLNADVYIELYGQATEKLGIGGKYQASASMSAKAFETSTANLLAQAAYTLPSAHLSRVSMEDALQHAMKAVVYNKNLMGRLVEQVSAQMAKLLLDGIMYDVVIQNPPNDRVMSKFWKNVKRDIESYKLIYQSEDEVKYSVWMIGGVEDLKEAFYDASESVSGLEDMYAVLVRGKSITFNSGL